MPPSTVPVSIALCVITVAIIDRVRLQLIGEGVHDSLHPWIKR